MGEAKHGSVIDQARKTRCLTGLTARKCRSDAASSLFRKLLTIMNRKVSQRLLDRCSALQKSRQSRIGNARLSGGGRRGRIQPGGPGLGTRQRLTASRCDLKRRPGRRFGCLGLGMVDGFTDAARGCVSESLVRAAACNHNHLTSGLFAPLK